MPETIPLPGGHAAEIRTELTGGDQRWFYTERDKLMRSNGTGKPARTDVDPDNPAVMKDFPAEPPVLTADDNFTMIDRTAARLLLSCTMPGIVPWSAAVRESLDLDVVDAIDKAVSVQMLRMQGVSPKPAPPSTSTTTSPDSAPASLTGPPPPPSVTAPGS